VSQSAIIDLGAESRATIAFAEARIKANLSAVANGVELAKKELSEKGELSPERFTQILSAAAKEVHILPGTAIACPRIVEVVWSSPDAKTGFRKSNPKVHVSGFGFHHPDAAKRLSVIVRSSQLNGDKPAKHVVNTENLLTIELDDAALQHGNATSLEVLWDNRVLHRIEIVWRIPPPDSPQGITLVWSADRKVIKSTEPTQWDFQMVPSFVRVYREDNSAENVRGRDAKLQWQDLPLRHDDQFVEVTFQADNLVDNVKVFRIPLKHKFEPSVPAVVKKTVPVALGTQSFTPPHTASDDNFWGKIRFKVIGRARLYNGVIQTQVEMFATEVDDANRDRNETTAMGSSDWRDAFRPDEGWKIASVVQRETSEKGFIHESNAQPIKYSMPNAEVVKAFHVRGVKPHGKAGTDDTSVVVEFNTIEIEVESMAK
jgi:hypothetical protein